VRSLAIAGIAALAIAAVVVVQGDIPPPGAHGPAATPEVLRSGASASGATEATERSALLTPLAVWIEDSSGQPIGGCHVRAMHRATLDPGGGVREGITTDSGVVHLSVPPADQPYLILANWTVRTLPDRARNAADVDVHDGPVDLRLVLDRLDSSLEVQVFDDLGQPVAGWPVQVNHEERVASTGANGTVLFEHLPAGDRSVDLGVPTGPAADLVPPASPRQTVRLLSRQLSRVRFVVERMGSLEVTLPEGTADGFAAVVALRPEGAQQRSGPRAMPIAAGRTATFPGLRPGEYWLTAQCGAATDWNCVHCDRVVVDSGARTTHRLQVERYPGTLVGTVVEVGGRGVAGAPVWAFLLGPRGERLAAKQVLTGADGRFELRGIPDADVRCLVDVEAIQAANYCMFRQGPMPFCTLPWPARDVVLRLERGHRLVGRVLRACDGKPMADEPVYLQHVDWVSSRRACTRHDQERPRMIDSALDVGWFEFAHLEPGEYEVWCGEGTNRASAKFSIDDDRHAQREVSVTLQWAAP